MSHTASLDLSLEQIITEHQLPGLAVVIRRDGEEEFARGYGYGDAAKRCVVTADTMFGVASVTKMVTAMLVMQLAERKRLLVNELVATHYASLKVAQRSPMRLSHLLSHGAGLPGLPCRFMARDLVGGVINTGGVSTDRSDEESGPEKSGHSLTCADDLVEALNDLAIRLIAPPGHLLNYNNEGFCLLGGVIEKLNNAAYADLVHDSIFAPLDMSRSTVGLQRVASYENVANPLLRLDGGFSDTQVWDAPLFYPAGGIIASARDLVKLMSVFDSTTGLLRDASIAQMTKPHMTVASRPERGVKYGYGFGIEVSTIDAQTQLIWHTGQRAGISSFVGRLTPQNIEIAVLCNLANAPTASIGHRLLSQVLGRDDVVWPPVGSITRQSSDEGKVRKSHSSLERFTGDYRSKEGFAFTVEGDGGQLFLCSAERRDHLVFVDNDSGVVGDQSFRFLDDPVESLALDLRILARGG